MSTEKTEDFNIELTELEFKYNADDMKLGEFVKFANSMAPEKRLEVASWDYYYSGPTNLPFEFLRFRNGPSPELTIKMKNDEKNNNNRFELDLPLRLTVSDWMVKTFVELFGFKENFRVFKYCDIYWYEKLDIVYYVIYNKDMVEQGRRIEIEARKDYPFKSAEEALTEVKAMEQRMAEIGLTPQNRMKKSMWEQFRK
jgi:adenylate cyclase class IV